MTLRITYALALLGQGLHIAAQNIQQAQFNQVINLNGDVWVALLVYISHLLILDLDDLEFDAIPGRKQSRNILTDTTSDAGQPEPSTTTRKPGHRYYWQPLHAAEHKLSRHPDERSNRPSWSPNRASHQPATTSAEWNFARQHIRCQVGARSSVVDSR